MDIKPITTDSDYRRTLDTIESLRTAKRDTPEGDKLNSLVALVEEWERKHYLLEPRRIL